MSLLPFNRATVAPDQLAYIERSFASDKISGDGQFSGEASVLLAELTGAGRAFLTPSCTAALEMCAVLAGVGPGDEVVVPSFTFVSTANAFVLLGARPVFADCEPGTLNIDPDAVASCIGPRTKVVVAMHYGGVACEMEKLQRACDDAGVMLVEDAAHGLLANWQGRPLGSFGSLATLSFHESKNYSCGEGGALLVNDPALEERAEIVREKGTNRSRFFKGMADKYTWVDVGSSYLMSDLSAAVLLAQLEHRNVIQARRHAVWRSYFDALAPWADARGVQLPTVPTGCEHPAHLFQLLLPSPGARTAFLAHTKARGVAATFHYLPLNASPMGRRLGGVPGSCPVAEDAAARLARLPLFSDITADEADRVIDATLEFTP